MAIKVYNSTGLLLALATLAAVSGCFCQAIPLPGENQCPTDARRLYCSCGEEAVRRCPLGPDSQFYGLKPTCWREWPEGWQCNGCEGMPYVDPALCGEPVVEAPVSAAPSPAVEVPTVEAPANAGVDLSNPFRSKPGAADLPLPPQARPTPPTQSAPTKTAPVQVAPAQPTPTTPPALEKVPTETPAAKPAPMEAAPSKKSTTGDSTDQSTNIVAVVAPPVASVVQAEATVPQPMPIVPAAIKMIPPAPTLIAPLNAPTIVAEAEPTSKPVRIAAAPRAEKKQAFKKPEISMAKDCADDPTLSNRIEQHLINNLRL